MVHLRNVGEKAGTVTLEVYHDLLMLVLRKAVANSISALPYFFSFLRCQR